MESGVLDLRPPRTLPAGLTRLPGIDIIRGLCILEVVIHHINIRIRFNKSPLGALLPGWTNNALFWSGSYAVKVFFVVSGFLITSTILARWKSLPEIDRKGFYRLRAARIAPLMLAVLAILSVLHLAGATGFVINPARTTLPRALLAALTFHVNWLETRVSYLPGAWDILWSLSVEEVFYLGYPVLCRFFRNRWLPIVLAASLIIAGPFFRTVLAPNEIGSDYAYLANMDGIAIGCITAVFASRIRISAYWGAAIMLYVVTVRYGLPKAGLDVTLLEIGTALTILGLTSPGTPSRWTLPMRWLGRNSYEVYLTHMFVVTTGTTLYTALGKPIAWAPLWFLGMFLAAAVMGDLVARFYSEPLNRKLRAKRSLAATAR